MKEVYYPEDSFEFDFTGYYEEKKITANVKKIQIKSIDFKNKYFKNVKLENIEISDSYLSDYFDLEVPYIKCKFEDSVDDLEFELRGDEEEEDN